MQARAAFWILFAAMLGIAPPAAAEIYKWVDADGSVHYGDTPPARSKNLRVVGKESGSVSVVPGIPKEEMDRLREREYQARLQRLEREVEELRAREQSREVAQPEVVYTDAYLPGYGYWYPVHGHHSRHGNRRPEQPIVKPRPPGRTARIQDPGAVRAPTSGLAQRQ
jgi:uncharacterized protein DUF4124